ncbi:MAG: PH domain-containing protein [Gordonia sp. (in: high G+C Gram-positive bacteria)]
MTTQPDPTHRLDTAGWEIDYRSQRLTVIAIVVAIVVAVIHLIFGILLTISNTGPTNIGAADQAAIVLLGVVIASAVALFSRPRLRVGAAGVSVRNLWADRFFGWEEVRGLTYPDSGFGGRLLLPADEHIPVLAIQALDGERAVAVMDRYRHLEARYGRYSGTDPR